MKDDNMKDSSRQNWNKVQNARNLSLANEPRQDLTIQVLT